MAGGRPTTLESGIRNAQKRAELSVKLLNRVGDEIKINPNLGHTIKKLEESIVLNLTIEVALTIETEIPSLRNIVSLIDKLEDAAGSLGTAEEE